MEASDIARVAYELIRLKDDRLRMEWENDRGLLWREIELLKRKQQGLKTLVENDMAALKEMVSHKLKTNIPELPSEKAVKSQHRSSSMTSASPARKLNRSANSSSTFSGSSSASSSSSSAAATTSKAGKAVAIPVAATGSATSVSSAPGRTNAVAAITSDTTVRTVPQDHVANKERDEDKDKIRGGDKVNAVDIANDETCLSIHTQPESSRSSYGFITADCEDDVFTMQVGKGGNIDSRPTTASSPKIASAQKTKLTLDSRSSRNDSSIYNSDRSSIGKLNSRSGSSSSSTCELKGHVPSSPTRSTESSKRRRTGDTSSLIRGSSSGRSDTRRGNASNQATPSCTEGGAALSSAASALAPAAAPAAAAGAIASAPVIKYVDNKNPQMRQANFRAALRGHQCAQCTAYFNALIEQGIIPSEEMLQDVLQRCSRHKAKYSPPSTPSGYWDLTVRTPPDWK